MSGTPDQQENATPGAVREALAALKVALKRTRQSLLFEKIWPVAVSLAAGIGIFLAISWAGLWIALPPMARIAGLVLLVALVVASLFPALRIRLPGNSEAVRRLEQGNASTHRPATALTDRIASKPDPMAEALWREHVARTADAAKQLRAKAPRPQLALRDPLAIRALILLGVVVTFFVAEGDRMRRVAAAFDWTGALTPRLYRVDAWVAPPQYTARAPVLLTGIRHDEAAAGETPLVMVPAGSTLIVRATNLANLDLAIDGKLQEEPNPNPQTAAAGIERHFRILDDASVTVRGLPSGTVTWHFRAIPDRVPVIELLKNPEISGRNAFSLNYKIEDDYGVTAAEAKFERVVPANRNNLSPRPLVNAPDFQLVLPQARTKSGAATTARDLTEHPWAGAPLRMTLHARDEGGNTGVSQTYEVTIPQRPFEKPLARALIEQRRELAFDANARGRVQRALDALMIAPDRFTTEANVYLGLRTASTRLRLSRTDDDLRGVIDYLWEIAVLIEDGTLSDVERDLRAAENALKQALERGASEEEIRKLMDQLRAALEKYLQALAEQQNRQSNDNVMPDANVRTLRPQDLKNMLDRIERMARQGDLSGAQKLLSELQSLMQNLQRNRRNAGPQQDQNTPLDQLGRMIQEQQRLRDRTFRQGRENPRGDQQQKGQKQQRQTMRDLQKNQGDLRQQLEQMLEQLRKRQQGQGQDGQDGPGKEAGEALNRAEQAMRDAEDALGNGDAEGAVDQQGRALQSLRQGAQAMADAMQGPGDGPGDPNGPEAEAAERTDPLGRPTRNRDFGDDYTVKVPDEIDAQRARRVLEELRRRLSDPNRPRLELEYLDRLLRE